ncbi:MAG: hypothetical protein L6Q71_06335, partial [Planctomycetes bacterium]|nr:hypothetical protein [Planctomycetota bacterium]
MKTIAIFILTAASVMCFVAGANSFAETPKSAPELFRNADSGGADAPSGRLLLRVPAASPDPTDPIPPAPPTEDSQPPVEPEEPVDNGDNDGAFFGEELHGRVIVILDMSNSMHFTDVGSGEDLDGNVVSNLSRLDCVKFEAMDTVRKLDETTSLDFVIMSGYAFASGYTSGACANGMKWKGELVPMTDSAREEAIQFIQTLTLDEGTPTWPALQVATRDYGSDIQKFILMTDGCPQPVHNGTWANSGRTTHKEAVLADFPVWFAPMAENGCE